VPRGVPYCKIAFDPENDLWYREVWYPGHPIHNQACVYPTIEAALLGADPHERAYLGPFRGPDPPAGPRVVDRSFMGSPADRPEGIPSGRRSVNWHDEAPVAPIPLRAPAARFPLPRHGSESRAVRNSRL
jgi:hypothetical protein